MSLHEEKGRPNPAGYRDVEVADVVLPLVNCTIIDVRAPDEFVGELGHLPGARLVPGPALLAEASGWPKDDALLLVCRSGGRSANAATALVRAGFTRVANLVGGMLAWNAAGQKTER
jgi:rhodanese-related sulfurtransferase